MSKQEKILIAIMVFATIMSFVQNWIGVIAEIIALITLFVWAIKYKVI